MLFPLRFFLGSSVNLWRLTPGRIDATEREHERLRPYLPPLQLRRPANPLLQNAHLNNHSELISFHVIQSPNQPLVHGNPWLTTHNHHIDWHTRKVLGWSNHCLASCLRSAPVPLIKKRRKPVISQICRKSPHYILFLRKYSTRPEPPHYHFTVPTFAPLICFPAQLLHVGDSFPCQLQNNKPFSNIISEALTAGLI